MQSDLRAVLQYVPSFRGKIFVLVVDAASMTELALAEALLDLTALQQVGVQLVLVSVGSGGSGTGATPYRWGTQVADLVAES